jgi:hypothetical protein
MARTRIFKKDGTPTPFFWSDKDGNALSAKRVYKKTADGVKRMRGVRFDVEKKEFRKDD